MTFFVAVEGHGDQAAVPNLLNRLVTHLGHPQHVAWSTPPLRMLVSSRARAEQLGDLLRNRSGITGLLVLRDDDDGCPRETGPLLSSWFADLQLPFPVANTLFYREYETLFLPCLAQMAGRPLVNGAIQRPGLISGAVFLGDPESRRDAKGIVSEFMPGSQRYKETVDQLALTRLMPLPQLDLADLPCWGTLKRSVQYLIDHRSEPGAVYPPPS